MQSVLVLTDIVGSTALNEAVGDAAMRRAWEHHDRLARALMRRCGGTEIGRTDGLLVTFERVADAVAFARGYHALLDGLDPPFLARVGIHVGEVHLHANAQEDVASGATRYDIDGIALPVAARIASVAGERQTLLSAAAAALLVRDAALRSHGHWRLKGVDDPVELFEAGDERSGYTPPVDGEKAYRVLLRPDGWTPAREIRHSVPQELDAFVGRAAELRHTARAFEIGTRLVSLVGIGGAGKTRTARRYARLWLGDFPGGAWFCDLTEAHDRDTLLSAVAKGLEVTLSAADPRNRLRDAIAGRGRCLVVLDNFEQVAALAGDTVGHWLEGAPEARFLVTSRERLRIAGERVVAIDSLSLPDGVELFKRRAAALRHDLRFDHAQTNAIERLVRLIDGLPLAIELAAGRSTVMSPATMLARMDQRLTLLAAGSSSSKRQSTLRATFDWSWELLAPLERGVLAQASVFVDGFTLQAAEAVMSTSQASASGVLDALQSLVDKSFLQFDGARFRLLASVRDYAQERLSQAASNPQDPAGDPSALERRHGAYFTDAARVSIDELENVLAACLRAVARGDATQGARGCDLVWPWLERRGLFRVGLTLIEQALRVEGLPPEARIPLTFVHGRFLLVAGAAEEARQLLEGAWHSAQQAGMGRETLRALASLAELNLMEGRLEEASSQYGDAVASAERIGDAGLLCAALNGLGDYHNRLGDFQSARQHFARVLEVARGAGHRPWTGGALANLGQVAANLGRRAEAEGCYDEAIAIARELGDRVWEGNLLCNVGLLILEGGNAADARAHLERSLELAREGGLSLLESVVLCNLGLMHEALGDAKAAEQAYRAALEVAGRRGDTRCQGQVLGYLGLVVARSGHPEEGRRLLVDAAAKLRVVHDRLSLAIALCRYAQGCRLWGKRSDGTAPYVEAAQIAADIGVAEGSELAMALSAARASLDGEAQALVTGS